MGSAEARGGSTRALDGGRGVAYMFWRAVLAGILMSPGALFAENICPAPPAGSDPLQITEADLTYERYREALSFLKGGLTEALQRHTK